MKEIMKGIVVHKDGSIFINGRKSNYKPNKYGYLRIRIKGKIYSQHRLIAEAFILNLENKPQINHKNGIKSDNRIENLEWCSPSENVQHAIINGLIKRGEDHFLSKLKNKDIIEIFKLSEKGLTQRKIAKMFNVSQGTIFNILNKKKYKNVIIMD